MSEPEAVRPAGQGGSKLSVDTWAVLVALALALLVRVGVLKHIAW